MTSTSKWNPKVRLAFRAVSIALYLLIFLTYAAIAFTGYQGDRYFGRPSILAIVLGLLWVLRGGANLIVREIDKDMAAYDRLTVAITMEETFQSPLLQDFVDNKRSLYFSPLLEDLLDRRRMSQSVVTIESDLGFFASLKNVLTFKDVVTIALSLVLIFMIWGVGLSLIWYWIGSTFAVST